MNEQFADDSEFDDGHEDAESKDDFPAKDAFILGGMIVGQAFEEALDEKEQEKRNTDD